MDSTVVLFNAIAKEPAAAVNQWFSFLSEVGSIASGKSERKPEAGDKRFAKASSADGFLAEAEKKSGSWWLHWRDWLIERCGEEIPAPSKLGSACHPAGAPALGTYVFD